MMKRIFALVVVLLALSAGPALPHATLVSSSPEANSTVGEMPSLISLEFNEQLLVIGEKSGNQLSLISPSGDVVTLESVKTNEEFLTGIVVGGDFSEGTYVVDYRAVSADGHVIENKYEFTLELGVLQPTVTSNMDREESNLNRWLGVVSGLFLLMAIITTWWRFKDSKGR
jgi:methionine-rich copper-binding protein CopC